MVIMERDRKKKINTPKTETKKENAEKQKKNGFSRREVSADCCTGKRSTQLEERI